MRMSNLWFEKSTAAAASRKLHGVFDFNLIFLSCTFWIQMLAKASHEPRSEEAVRSGVRRAARWPVPSRPARRHGDLSEGSAPGNA